MSVSGESNSNIGNRDNKVPRDPKRLRRRFYLITVIILAVVFATAAILFEYQATSFVEMNVLGSSHSSLIITHDSQTVSLSPSENATIELPPHTNITVQASLSPPYGAVQWNVSGVSFVPTGDDTITLMTGAGGSSIQLSIVAETTTTSSNSASG